ncbi:hypothetical protein TWF506_009042 [Arthrobotrys conoides]|uniref:Uncharacterized protein n=1 Tax=Arthrobotrys conoides TaxID=74498 RepID=A0AAN8RR08_9PEZI
MLTVIAAIPPPPGSDISDVDSMPKVTGNISAVSHNTTEANSKKAWEIPSNFFYKDGRMKVRCNPPDWAYRLPVREVPSMGIELKDWPDWSSVPHSEALVRCFCTAELVSRVPEDKNLPIWVLQEALDSLPDTVQGHNPDFRWNYGGGTLRFSQPRRYLDPETAEPYYLEGPDFVGMGMTPEYYRDFRHTFGLPIDPSHPYGLKVPIKNWYDTSKDEGPGGSGGDGPSGPGGPGGSGDGDPGGSGSAGTAKAKR